MEPYFLEAHYYSGGLRHHAYHSGDSRPDWAPQADAVGFADEFPLDAEHSAIELRRIQADGHELTWLAIYFRSVDAKLGDRQNHAGVGVWMCDLIPTDFRSLLYGLSQLAYHIAENIDVQSLEEPASHFQTDAFLPRYVGPISSFAGLAGMPASVGAIVEAQLHYVKCPSGPGNCKLLSDFLTAKMLLGDSAVETSKVLVMAGPGDAPPKDPQRFKVVSDELEVAAKLVKAIPVASEAALAEAKIATTELAKARDELARNEAELAEAQTLKATYEKFSKDPLATVLDRIERLSDEVHGLASRVEQQRSLAPQVVQGFTPIRPRPQPTADIPQEYEWDLVGLGIWACVIIILVVIIIVAIERFW